MPKYRMFHVDHYMAKPLPAYDDQLSDIDEKPVHKVPVIRVFGADSKGQKICLHVHGFYPYISIQIVEKHSPEIAHKIINEIESALNLMVDKNKFNRDRRHQAPNPQAPSKTTKCDTTTTTHTTTTTAITTAITSDNPDTELYNRVIQERKQLNYLSKDQKFPIHRIESIHAFNYYGYHNEQEDFYKLHLYNPRMVKQLATLFEEGRVFGRFIPVFWAHLPYVLLFFIDNNLRGMQFIEVDRIDWRRNKAPSNESFLVETSTPFGSQFGPNVAIEADEFSDSSADLDDDSDNDIGLFTAKVNPISTCELEGDIRFEWILNRQRMGSNDDALRELWLDDQEGSQTSSKLWESKLPLFSLELNYLQQLCDTFGIEETDLNLQLTERFPKTEQQESSQETNIKQRTLGDEINSDDDSNPWEDDQDEFSRIASSSISKAQSQENDEQMIDKKTNITITESKDIKIEKTPAKKASLKQPYTDNSLIDGRSALETTPNLASRAGSQRSATSAHRETVNHEYQFLTTMSMELHATTRGKLRPNPASDPIEAVFYCIRNDVPESSDRAGQMIGMIISDPLGGQEPFEWRTSTPTASNSNSNSNINTSRSKSPGARSNISICQRIRSLLGKTGLSPKDLDLHVVDTEIELIMTLVELVKFHDPEILLGYEVELLSWGYVLERATILDMNVAMPLSRITDKQADGSTEEVQSRFVQPIIFTGRMVFSVWRIVKHEINLTTWSYERLHNHTLGERVPCFAFETLTEWFNQNRNRWRVIDYYFIRVVGQMRILDKFDLISKVSELARVYGTQFIDVITRGSQIGIESMMLRLAKVQNLTPLSPTVMQRNKMRAPEALPLVLEPETDIYYDPVAVLDFQSLYPSVGIAYNYCYSTCLGRVIDLETKGRFQFGCSQLQVSEDEINRLLKSDGIHVSPVGVAFVKKNIRRGVLPKMLSELIVTRALVKDQMKKNMRSDRPNKRLQRILDHRQHGLKMMANTTFGYAGASYTGRMPCVEIADSLVSKGRETLERAIELVESREEWGAKVVYGDTDSIFIQFKNCDRETAFKRAMEMVDAITASNPYPIKMKFEKIYQPCVLQTKKRYCGFKFESPGQSKPEFEVKGMEVIRRDCCPAAAKMLEMALRIQFTTRDIEQVKRYVQNQFVKIMSGKLSNMQDYFFARKYKIRDIDKTEATFVPVWHIAKRLGQIDPRCEPREGERMPFVITYGEPKIPLVKLAKTPLEMLENLSLRVNADYYIQKVICPTLNRVFCTMKVDTLVWYKSMPHGQILHRSHYLAAQQQQTTSLTVGGIGGHLQHQATMSQYFCPSHCPVCAKPVLVSDDICDSCRQNLQSSSIRLSEELNKYQRKLFAIHQLCRACSALDRNESASSSGNEHHNPCISYDCPNLFRYHQAKLDALSSNYLCDVLKALN